MRARNQGDTVEAVRREVDSCIICYVDHVMADSIDSALQAKVENMTSNSLLLIFRDTWEQSRNQVDVPEDR